MTTRPVLANTGAMSQFIGAFEVTSKLSGQTYQCRFSHMWNGIREASFVAAEYLRERLEEEDVRPLYDVPEAEVLRLIAQVGIK